MSDADKLIEFISGHLTKEEIDECIRQGIEDAKKELAELEEKEHEGSD